MKTEKSVKASMMSRLEQAKEAASNLEHIADSMMTNEPAPKTIQALRNKTERITQCVHEFNAYWNPLHTD